MATFNYQLRLLKQKPTILGTSVQTALQDKTLTHAEAVKYDRNLEQLEERIEIKLRELLEGEITSENAELVLDAEKEITESIGDTRNRLANFIHDEETRLQAQSSQASMPRPTTKSNPPPLTAKLPEIALPVFSGQVELWQSFWDQFTALVDNRTDLPNVTKLTYLKSQLRGNPAHLLCSIPLTDASYGKAVQLLKSTYADDNVIADQLVRKLTFLKKPTYSSEDLMNFRAEVENILGTLENLGRDVAAASWFIAVYIKDKLPAPALEYIQTKASSEYPTLDEIRVHLVSVIHHLNTQVTSLPTPKASNTQKEVPVHASTPKQSTNSKGTLEKSSVSVARGNVQKMPLNCLFCGSDKHKSSHCTKYPSRSSRQEQLKHNTLCTKCCRKYEPNHKCYLKTCMACKKGAHHVFLCDETIGKLQPNSATNANNSLSANASSTAGKAPMSSNTTVASAVSNRHNETCILPIAQVGLLNKRTKEVSTQKLLLDTGSQRTFIHSSAAKSLGLTASETVQMRVEGFTGVRETRTYDVARLTARIGRSYIRMKALITEDMPRTVTVHGLSEATRHLEGKIDLNVTRQPSDVITDINILVGMDSYFKIAKGHAKIDGVNLIKTPGGHLIAGKLPNKYAPTKISQNVALVARVTLKQNTVVGETLEEIRERVEDLWKLDQLGVKSDEILTPEEQWVETQFEQTVKFEDGQYWVRMPWRPDHPTLLSNQERTYCRTKQMYNKLAQNSEQLPIYHEALQKQIDQNFTEVVPDVNTEKGHYLPHLCVIKDSTTTPLRIVYDCSAKGKNNVSLNDCLYKGPKLTERLNSVLIKFRTERYATIADISKAFLRVGLQEEDRDFTKFLGPHGVGEFDPPVTYRFKSVLFGSTSSPYLLQAVLKYHLGTVHKNSPNSQRLLDSLYVDNLQYASPSESEALSMYRSAQQLIPSAGMPLQEWQSNSTEIQKAIQADYPGETQLQITTVLGLKWNVSEDALSIKPVKFTPVVTKRQLLSNCSKVYDPLGLVSPITTAHKILMQSVWKLNLEWDEELPSEIVQQWNQCLKDADGLETILIPRTAINKDQSNEIHVFTDASPKAYGACIYICSPGQKTHLLQAKSRVAPLEERTLPQLELSAMLVGIKLLNTVKSILKDYTFLSETLWTDSQIALNWVLNNKSNCVYVRNRVRDIRKEYPTLNIQYVNTEENPADFLTKPRSAEKVKHSSLWFHGPDWLEYHQPENTKVLLTKTANSPSPQPILDYTKYNSLDKLLGVTNKTFEAINRMRKGVTLPTPSEYWTRYVQKKHFPQEYQYLERTPKSTTHVTTPNLVRDLRLGFDQETKLIVVEGRLQNSDIKPQVLLPKGDHWTTLIVRKVHDSHGHCGTNQTLSQLRTEYWIPQGRQKIRTVLKDCYLCKRLTGPSYPLPSVPALPKERVVTAKPFEIVGIDYFGPITLHQRATLVKLYGALFTCATTRAVHLELAEDLSAETFINCFRSFIARRSCPNIVISDNATNFTSSAVIINKILEQTEFQDFFRSRQITWNHIPPRAPWMGGFYERLVGVVKGSLRKALFRRQLTQRELRTVLTEVEAQVNNRPLTYQSDDPKDLEALTPNHLLIGRPITTFPIIRREEEFEPVEGHEYYTESYRKLCDTMTKWRHIWMTDYLNSLKERKLKAKESKTPTEIVKVGDVCILADQRRREQWQLCLVTEVFPDQTGDIRIVRVRTSQGEFVRSIKHLYPLERECEQTIDIASLTGKGQPNGSPPTEEVSVPVDNERDSSTNCNTDVEAQPQAMGPETLEEVREPQGRNDDPLSCDPSLAVQDVNSIGSKNLNRHKGRRAAAVKCKNWLKEVCDSLNEDDQ